MRRRAHAGIVPGNRGIDEPTHPDLVTRRFKRRLATAVPVLVLVLLGVAPLDAAAQSARQLGAWDGLVLSPVGALAPIARDQGDTVSRVNELSLRYGRWRYDEDDVEHDNVGLTWSHGLGFARAQLAITGAYVLVECPTCSAWAMGGVDLQSTLWSRSFAGANGRPISTGVGVRVSFGASHDLGGGGSTAASAAVTLPIGIALSLRKSSVLCASIVPGFGFGRISSADLAESGVLPMVGAAVAWTITSRIGVDLGVQRVIIAGGPTQVGAAFSLKLGSDRSSRP